MAGEIARELPSREVLLIGLMTGAYVLAADLGRALSRHGVSVEVTFVRTC